MAELAGSLLVLLEQIRTQDAGTKVRFLGCVHAYIVDKAELVLREQYPATNDSDPVAVVKLAAVLENLGQEIVQVGSWVNVVGNVRAHSNDRTARGARTSVTTVVDATMIWCAGAIKPDKYRTAVLEYQKPLQNG